MNRNGGLFEEEITLKRINTSFLSSTKILEGSFINTVQLVTSSITPFVEIARVLLSIIIFILVHYSPLYRTTAFGLHIRCLAVFDACRVIERLFYWLPPLSFFVPKAKYTRCNLALFLHNYFSHLSIVTIVFLSIERCIILWFPFRARYLISVRIGIIEELINVIVMFIVNHFYLIPGYFVSMDAPYCFYARPFYIYNRKLIFDYKVYTIVDIVLCSLVPCILTIISIILIIIGLKKHKRHQERLRSTQQQQQQQSSSIYETSIVLVTIALLQVTTTFPTRLLLLLRYFIYIETDFYTALYHLFLFNELLASTFNFVAFVLPFHTTRIEFIKIFFAFCHTRKHTRSTISSTPRIAIINSGV